ncbi:hypothetical protein NDA16_000042 [Ustilago loliicola]|nr:hypothetical protein NDA16_000042 [Ustilago loliicola]
MDSYEGWRPSETNPKIAKVSNDISAADMWTHFISKRRPVIIDGLLKDSDWKANKWTDLEYLRSAAGQVPVKIEPVHPHAGHFGTSVKRKKVRFSEFLDILKDPSSSGKWYLTTQYVEEGEEEQQSQSSSLKASTTTTDTDSEEDSDNEPEVDNVLPAPTNALSNDFPAKPELLGDLVLQQCNLWLGNSKEGKSSGLHHDFHDNLYILLSGYKRFLLFPPSAHRYLHPRGFIDRVHPNGLIVYAPPGELPCYMPGRKQQLPIRPDGLVPSDAARWRRKARLRIKREIDERAAADAGEGSREKSQRKGKAKQTRAQELAEEALLQAEAELRICRMDEDGIDPEADTSDEEDDYDINSNADLDNLLSTLVDSNGAQRGETSDDEQEGSNEDEDDQDDDDDDNQAQLLLASLPASMRPLALAALAGDPASTVKLKAYLENIATSDRSDAEDGSDPEQDSDQESAAQLEEDLSASEGEDESASEDDDQNPGEITIPRTVPSNGVTRKRKGLSASEAGEDLSEDEADESESETARSDSSRGPVKRVKIASGADPIDFSDPEGSSEQSGEDSEALGSQSNAQDSSEDDEESGLPTFAGADSGSEFGDVDEGEAELERLLAIAQGQDPDAESPSADDENEPPSFSRIPPHVLHRCLNVPDDPSRPAPKATNGSSGKQKANGLASEPYKLMPGCPPPIEVFLKPGQMLYLPASWYHEVTSSSLPPLHHQEASKGGKKPHSEVHMALNYWFHPPDALEFEPVEPRQASRASNEVTVPGLGVGLGDSALENRGAGTGSHERSYRDAEVWDEVARAVEEQIKLAKQGAFK